MSEWEIRSLQKQLDRLDKRVWKESTINFVWLILLSNILFLLIVGYICLKKDIDVHQSSYSDMPKMQKNKNS